MTLEDFASRLDKAKPKTIQGCTGYKSCCPAHEDKEPSFGVWEKDGWLHVKCLKGCSEDQILGSLGLISEDRRVHPLPIQGQSNGHHKNGQAKGIQRKHTYRDLDGSYLFDKIIVKFDDGSKKAYQSDKRVPRILPDGAKNPAANSISHLGDKQKTLYNAPELAKAIQEGLTVYLNEGEKACDRMAKDGKVATCQPGGATKDNPQTKWLPMHTQAFKNATVVMVVDRDEVGEIYGRYVASQLVGVCKSLRVVQSKTENPKDDAYDHLEAGYGYNDWVERKDLLPPRGLITHSVSGFDIKDPTFLFGRHLRKAQMNIIDGDGGTGKSSLVLALAAAGSIGYDPIFDKKGNEPFKTLYFGGEDDPGDLRWVYEKMGGQDDYLHIFQESLSLTPSNLRLVRETIMDGDFKMVVFDALLYYLNGVTKDMNSMMELVVPLHNLRNVAMETGCAIVNLRHTGKGKDGAPISEKGVGSVQVRNSHRSQLVMQFHPDFENNYGVRIVTHEKGSMRVEKALPFGWRFNADGVIDWLGPMDEKILRMKEKDLTDHHSKVNAAYARIVNMCSQGAWVSREEIDADLETFNISPTTILHALRMAKVVSKREDFKTWYRVIDANDPFDDGSC